MGSDPEPRSVEKGTTVIMAGFALAELTREIPQGKTCWSLQGAFRPSAVEFAESPLTFFEAHIQLLNALTWDSLQSA